MLRFLRHRLSFDAFINKTFEHFPKRLTSPSYRGNISKLVFAIPVSSPRKIYFNEIYSSRKFSRVKRYLSNISGKIDHFYFQGSLRNDKRKEKNTNSKSHRITEISRFFEIIITIEHISNNYPRIVGIIFLDNIE